MRKRPGIAARPWETSPKLSRTLHWSALRSTWTARWGPADDLPLIRKPTCVRDVPIAIDHQLDECGRTSRRGAGVLCCASSGASLRDPCGVVFNLAANRLCFAIIFRSLTIDLRADPS